MSVDQGRMEAFVGQVLRDLGGALSIPLVRIGDRLGLYKTLDQRGPLTADDFAEAAEIAPRYAREWLSHQAASGYVAYDQATETFSLPAEQAAVFARPESPFYLQGAFDLAAAVVENQRPVEAAFRTGAGVGWGDQAQCLFCAVGRFFRPSYHNLLIDSWLPALDGVVDKLNSGGMTVADVGCGHGFSTLMMAKAFPKSSFTGFDFHDGSIAQARLHAEEHGVGSNARFDIASAAEFPGAFDLVTFFDCLHDMGDPVGAATHAAKALKPGGTLMVVEPQAGDTLTSNLNPIGRMSYAASTMVCVPTSLAQPVGLALGAQAGFARLAEVLHASGFSSVRKASETPFNMVIEARL